jgi:hypothetical protein
MMKLDIARPVIFRDTRKSDKKQIDHHLDLIQ